MLPRNVIASCSCFFARQELASAKFFASRLGGIAKPKIPTKHMSSTRGAPDAKKNSFTFLQPARRLSSGMSAQSGHGLIHMDANGLLIWMMVIPFFSRDGGRRTAERHSTITGVLCTLHDLHRKPADFHWPRSN